MASSRHPSGAFFAGEFQPRIGEMLLSRGLITDDQLAYALSNKHPEERLGEALVRLRIVFEDDLVRTLASQCGLEYIDLTTTGVDRSCARILPKAVARELDIIPVRMTSGGSIVVAAADPLEIDLELIEITLGAPVELKVAELSAIRRLLEAVWPAGSSDPPPAAPAGRAPAEAALRIRVSEPSHAGALRDYLQRLGADARLESEQVIAVKAGSLRYASEGGERHDIGAYLRAWTAMNQTAAELVD